MAIKLVLLDRIDDDPKWNPRSRLGDLEELVSSIKAEGQLYPIIAFDVGEQEREGGKFVAPKYRLVAGFRRLAAFKKLNEEEPGKWDMITVDVRPFKKMKADDIRQEMLFVSLAENMVRQSLNALDEAKAYQELKELGVSVPDISKRYGKTERGIKDCMRLLRLSETIQEGVREEFISQSAALEIARLPVECHAKGVGIARDLSVSKLKSWVSSTLKKLEGKDEKDKKEKAPELQIEVDPAEVKKSAIRVCNVFNWRAGIKLAKEDFKKINPSTLKPLKDLFESLPLSVEEAAEKIKQAVPVIEKDEEKDILDPKFEGGKTGVAAGEFSDYISAREAGGRKDRKEVMLYLNEIAKKNHSSAKITLDDVLEWSLYLTAVDEANGVPPIVVLSSAKATNFGEEEEKQAPDGEGEKL